MKHHERKIQLNNDGTTLVELIVSLLVLTIIVVPLLNGFVVAQRANSKAKANMYAMNAAENIMEAVKAINPDASEESARKIGQAFGMSVTSTTPGESWLEGYTEGTDTYDVKISITASGYSSDANNYKFASMSAFSDEKSVMIYPGINREVVDYDQQALLDFYEAHSDWMNAMWRSARESAQTAYDIAYNNWLANPVGPEPLRELPEQDDYVVMTDEQLRAKITRTLTITIDESISESGEYVYKLYSTMVYKLKNDYTLTIDGRSVSLGVCTNPAETYVTKEYSGYCFDSEHKGIDSIYVIYEPFADEIVDNSRPEGKRNNQLDFKSSESVSVTSNATKDMNVYIVVQTQENLSYTQPLPVSFTNNGTGTGSLNLYSQAPLSCTDLTSDRIKRSIVADMTSTLNRVFTVDVDVYASGDHVAPLARLSSTILQQPGNK